MTALLDLFLPPACASCGRTGALLCGACRERFTAPSRREDRFVAPDGGVVLGDALILAIAAFAHEGPVRRALAALKYTGASRLAAVLAEAALPAVQALVRITGPAALVPVPVHRDRLRERGYNQAQLIAKALGRSAGVPCAELLERVRPTTKQHRLDRAARLANLREAFAMKRDVELVPATVILVDDIVTTTATLEACAAVLRDAGVEAVYGFAVAREV
jgi:ComF family protein